MKTLSLLVVLLVACENATPEPQNQTPNPQYPSASAAPAPPPPPPATPSASVAAAPTTAPPPPTTPPPPPSFPTFQLPNIQLPDPSVLAKALPSLPIDPNLLNQIKQVGQQLMTQGGLTLGDPVDVGLKAAALQHAPLMLPEGAAYKDALGPGTHKAFDVTLAGNKCYTIVAYSPTLSGVSLHLLVPPFYNMDAGHDDSATGTAAIQNVCPFTLIPIPYRVDVSARAGQGQVAVQVYSKAK
ncbi:MAG TPA: hypothetical protein VGH28_30775 [Polyangiaceae bacterium]|jgi:hypothetical protein